MIIIIKILRQFKSYMCIESNVKIYFIVNYVIKFFT